MGVYFNFPCLVPQFSFLLIFLYFLTFPLKCHEHIYLFIYSHSFFHSKFGHSSPFIVYTSSPKLSSSFCLLSRTYIKLCCIAQQVVKESSTKIGYIFNVTARQSIRRILEKLKMSYLPLFLFVATPTHWPAMSFTGDAHLKNKSPKLIVSISSSIPTTCHNSLIVNCHRTLQVQLPSHSITIMKHTSHCIIIKSK